jgi:hypothetical protein
MSRIRQKFIRFGVTSEDVNASQIRELHVNVSSNITLFNNRVHFVNTSAARSLTLPAASAGARITVKDITGSANVNNITIVRAGSEKIENVAASYVMDETYRSITLVCDGTDWWII